MNKNTFNIIERILRAIKGIFNDRGTNASTQPEPQTLVPRSKDGSVFHKGLRKKRGYIIGAKGEEIAVEDFSDALKALHAMETPRWRRPNRNGNWGIVSGVEWVDQNEA